MTREQHLENRRLRLEDEARSVLPYETTKTEIIKLQQEWGRMGVRSCLLLNGGALALLPALHGLQEKGAALNAASIAASAQWFVAGLIAAGVALLSAYFNLTRHQNNYDHLLASVRQITVALYSDATWPTEEIKKNDVLQRKASFDITVTLVLGLLAAVASAGFFIVGTLRLVP